jgi:hypothetical protein
MMIDIGYCLIEPLFEADLHILAGPPHFQRWESEEGAARTWQRDLLVATNSKAGLPIVWVHWRFDWQLAVVCLAERG